MSVSESEKHRAAVVAYERQQTCPHTHAALVRSCASYWISVCFVCHHVEKRIHREQVK